MLRGGAVLARIRLFAGVVAVVAGCELLVDGDLGTIHCSDEGAVGLPACPEGNLCEDGSCVGLSGLGKVCAQDADCVDGDFCLDPSLFGAEGPRFCARGCCNSSDCDPESEFVCWVPERTAFGFCRSGSSVGRAVTGARTPGEACAAGGECRSGACVGGACVDTCCSDASCAAAGQTCQLTAGLVSTGATWACQPVRPAKAAYLDPCAADDDCASGACVEVEGETRCTIPCCGSGDCPGILEPQPGNVSAVQCALVDRGGSLFRACAAPASTDAIGAVGAPCTTADECRGSVCYRPEGAEGVCSDLCCTDQACGDPAGFGCRPAYTGRSWALRCEPK